MNKHHSGQAAVKNETFTDPESSELGIPLPEAEAQTVNLSLTVLPFPKSLRASISGRNAPFVGRDHTSQIPAQILRRENYTKLIHCLYRQIDIIVS